MELWALGLIVGSILAATAAFLWMASQLRSAKPPSVPSLPDQVVQQLLTPAFIEDLRKQIHQELTHSMATQADESRQQLVSKLDGLHHQIAQQLQSSVQQEFGKYEASIASAKDLIAVTATKGQEALQQQQQTILHAYEHDLEVQKNNRLLQFDERMTDIISQYVLSALGRETEGKDQLAQILHELENHKEQIVEDMRHA